MATLLLVGVMTALLGSGCSLIKGPNAYTLPGGVANGSDGYPVTVEFRTVNDLVPNSMVKYNDVTIGTVRSIKLDGWNAVADLRLLDSVALPANVIAKIGQKSLLGAQYVELSDPPRPAGQLVAGQHIGLEQTGTYPGNEEVLSAVSLLLNNGGLNQINTITSELSAALSGREGDAKSLIKQLNTFLGTVERQKGNLVAALEHVDQIAARFARDRGTIERGLTQIAPGLEELERQRASLTEALGKVGDFSQVAHRVIKKSENGLTSSIRSMKPVLAELERSGKSLPESLLELTFPVPLQTVPTLFRGDFFNFFVTVDVSAQALVENFVGADDLSLLPSLVPGSRAERGKGISTPSTATSLVELLSPEQSSDPDPPAPASPPKSCPPLSALLGGC